MAAISATPPEGGVISTVGNVVVKPPPPSVTVIEPIGALITVLTAAPAPTLSPAPRTIVTVGLYSYAPFVSIVT